MVSSYMISVSKALVSFSKAMILVGFTPYGVTGYKDQMRVAYSKCSIILEIIIEKTRVKTFSI